MRRIILILIVLFCLPSCARRMAAGSSYYGAADAGIASIAADAVDLLADTYPPGHTTLYLEPAKADNVFGATLENGLRAKGFTLATSPENAIRLSYILDVLRGETACYLQLKLSDGRIFARAYNGSGQAEAGRSQEVR